MSATTDATLSYTRTVSRSLVHRAAICEVFLTDATRLNDGEYEIAAQLPRVHSYYSDHISAPAAYDPLLLVEIFRQASIFVAHRFLDAPTDNKFTFNNGELIVTDPTALRIGRLPGAARIQAVQAGLKHREDTVTGSSLDMVLTVDGKEAATMSTTTQWMPPAAWTRLRDKGRAGLELSPARPHHTGRRVTPLAVGRTSPQNVVLSEAVAAGSEVRAQVVVDRNNPALFDHPLDHIPGALIFEAYRQTALFAAHELFGLSPRGLTLTRVETDFTRFGEFELPTDCVARSVETPFDDTLAFEVVMLQEEESIARARVHLTLGCPLPGALASRLFAAA